MNRRSLACFVLGGLLVTACSSDDPGDADATTTQLTLLPTTSSTTTTTSTTTSTTSTTTTTTTTTTTVPETTTTEVPNPAISALVLSDQGVGSASFGADPDGVISYISSFLGAATADTGWVEPITIGACPGNELRLVSWGALTFTFGDASTVVQGRRHFFAYSYGIEGQIGAQPAGLLTSRGITVGSRVVDLRAAYPGVVLRPEDDFIAPNFYVNDNLRGLLTGLTDEATVTVILGGLGCGE